MSRLRCILLQAAEAEVPHEKAHWGGPAALSPLHQAHNQLLRTEEARGDPSAGPGGDTAQSGPGDACGTLLPAGDQSAPWSGVLGREEQ